VIFESGSKIGAYRHHLYRADGGRCGECQSDGGYVAPELSRPTPGHLLNQDYLTSTGETVPRPGVQQSSGTTPLDRAIREQNDRIDKSICTGC
jgi:hypothetical protein